MKYRKIKYGIDGNQTTAFYEDFINLQESDCGFGDTKEEALKDLFSQQDNISLLDDNYGDGFLYNHLTKEEMATSRNEILSRMHFKSN